SVQAAGRDHLITYQSRYRRLASPRQRGELAPSIGGWIVLDDVGNWHRVCRQPRYNNHVSVPHKNIGGYMSDRAWHGGGLRPGVGRGVVNVHLTLRGAALLALMLTTDGINLPVEGYTPHVIARIRHRRQSLLSVWCRGAPSYASVEIESPMRSVVDPC